METNKNLPSGEWNGFYLESHRPERGWMHLYLSFEDGIIKGEGTDYVGPWTCAGQYETATGVCHWKKQYVGRHAVIYTGRVSENGIQGQWEIACSMTGAFHIWPKSKTQFNELYMTEDLELSHLDGQPPTTLLESIPADDFLA